MLTRPPTLSPSCEATLLLAPDFHQLDDHLTSLASPHIASPALGGWTPRLPGRDAEDGPSLRSAAQAPLATPSTAPPALAVSLEPLEALPMPTLLHGNFMLPIPLLSNVRQYPAPEPHQPPATTDTDPPSVRLADPTPIPAVASTGELDMLARGHAPVGWLTAAQVTAAVVGSSAAAALEPAPHSTEELCQEDKPVARGGASNGNGPSSCPGSISGAAAAALDELCDTRLTLEFLEQNGYFDMPIQQAATELRVGVTTLKKVCRVNNIGRWPFRKRSSLNRLIDKTREYFAADPHQCAEALAQLEAQRSVLQAQQGEDIPESVKRYRQSIFKLDYKVKKIARERRTHRGSAAAQLAAIDKVQTIRQLGVGVPAASSLLSILCKREDDAEMEDME